MSRLTPAQRDEVLATMRASDNVRLRDVAVIATWLLEQPWVDDEDFDALDAAKSLIKAQVAAGLATYLQDDLTAFIGGLRYPEPHGGDAGTAAGDGTADRTDERPAPPEPTGDTGPGWCPVARSNP